MTAFPVTGIHHVTAICSDAQRNLDFYTCALGMRLVKLTVNFDDPTAYHLYYGDTAASPGTIFTFFSYPESRAAKAGAGFISRITLEAAHSDLPDRVETLRLAGVDITPHGEGFRFQDPDGIALELVPGARERDIAVRSVTMGVRKPFSTARMLTARLGLVLEGESLRASLGGPPIVALEENLGPPGHGGHGSVHHVAFRTESDASQEIIHDEMLSNGILVTPIIDRKYFHSIYTREPGGVLLEVATDGPGFTVDESLEELGSRLVLPPQHETSRDSIVRALPPLVLPPR